MQESKFAIWTTALSTFLGAISVLVGVITFIFSLSLENKKQDGDRILEWQRTIVYTTILQSTGISFDQIKQSYLTASQQVRDQIPVSEIQDEKLRLIILGLQKDNLISLNTDYKYRANALPQDYLSIQRDNLKGIVTDRSESRAYQNAYVAIHRLVSESSGTYTTETLREKMTEDGMLFDRDITDSAVLSLRRGGIIKIDDYGNLYSDYDYTLNDDPEEERPVEQGAIANP